MLGLLSQFHAFQLKELKNEFPEQFCTTGCPRINYFLGFGFNLNKNVIDGNSKEMKHY